MAGSPLSFQRWSVNGRGLAVPCGRCIGCRLERARQWSVRCVHEAQCWEPESLDVGPPWDRREGSSFVTLTYDDAHLPRGLTLVPKHLTDFFKRLRERCHGFRYFACGEYGSDYSRPHYHACLFGLWFHDRVFYKRMQSGFDVFTSAVLDDVWGFGECKIGSVTSESAGYCARYLAKVELGRGRGPKRVVFDVTTGEFIEREHEFQRVSLKPGLGARWMDRYFSDVYPHDRVVMDGGVGKPPRYYDKLLALRDPVLLEKLKGKRILEAERHFEDNSPRRLRDKETVTKARIVSLRRD